jgi:hypothetical protein
VAREHLLREGVVIVLVGRADELRAGLASRGEVEVIPITELDLDSPTLRTETE